MAKSSINFQKVSTHSFKHNSREEKRTAKTVFKEYSHLNECSRSAAAAKQMFDDLYKEAISKVTGRTRRAKKENCLVEAVVNLNADHTLKDVEKLVREIEKETGFTCLQIAVHKDEGQEQDGKLIRKNHHAHISFFTLDLQTGRQMFRREHLTKAKLSKLQDITAETLGMERGEKGSKRKRLSHKEYKTVAKEKEQIEYNFRKMQKYITSLENLTSEQKKELHRLNSKVKNHKAEVEELHKRIQELQEEKEIWDGEIVEIAEELNCEPYGEDIKQAIQKLKNELKKLKEAYAKGEAYQSKENQNTGKYKEIFEDMVAQGKKQKKSKHKGFGLGM